MRNVLITAGVSFMRSDFISCFFWNSEYLRVVNFDLSSYVRGLLNLKAVKNNTTYTLIESYIGDKNLVEKVFKKYNCSCILHALAATRLGTQSIFKTYDSSFSSILSEENRKQLFISGGLDYDYSLLNNNMTFTYICDNSYKLNDEGGINYKYSNFKIEWKLNKDRIRLSLKDENLLNLEVL